MDNYNLGVWYYGGGRRRRQQPLIMLPCWMSSYRLKCLWEDPLLLLLLLLPLPTTIVINTKMTKDDTLLL